MAKNSNEPVTVEAENNEDAPEDRGGFVKMTRKVIWAGLGGVTLAKDEAADFVNKLVERGELAEQDARQMIKDLTNREPKEDAEASEPADVAEKEGNTILNFAHNLLWAGLGVAAITQEGVEQLVNKLVERGELAEQDGRKLIESLKERRQNRAKAVEEELDKRLEQALTRLNLPSKTDIDDLSTQVTKLAKQVEKLKPPV
jgi:poly(hydroxyalkanoate) granule-associated protein